uniref:MANSC domain-containing protein n=1 Tax=Branchiostoma floridae TaxID=7739 RepID=C3ZC99_BRAFL|eukprot:XP_002593860.1 hypothetical protein BRAFLDRAFT_75680 [Branchiostoma floridae]
MSASKRLAWMESKPPVLLLLLLIIGGAFASELAQYGQCSLNFTDGKIINLRKSNLSFFVFSRMDAKPPVLLLLLVIIGAASASELAQYGQCSLNFTDGKIINLRKSKELGGAIFLSSFSSDSLEDCSHSCCDDTAGQCSVAVYHNDRNMDNCYHINCPDPQSCVYQDLAGYTLAIISRAVPQAEALGGTSTEKPATATTKTATTKSPEVNVIPEERMFKEKQQETTTTKSEVVKLTTVQSSTGAQPHTNATEQPGTPQQTTAAGERPTTEQHVPDTEQQTKPATEQPNPGTEQQQQMSTKPSSQLTTVTKTTTTPKTQSTQTFTQKQTTKSTTTTVVGKTTANVDEALQTTQASKTPEVAIQEIKQTTPSIATSTQKSTTKLQTIPPTNPPPTEKPSPVPSTKPTTTTSKQTPLVVTTKANPVPEATAAQTEASSTVKTPDFTAAETQPPLNPTSKPAAATTKKLMPESTAKEDHAVTQASLGSIGPQVAHRNESMSAADKLGKSSYGSLIVAMCFGLLFLFAVVVVVGKRWYESWQRRHYSKIDYLINGMYN